MLSYFKEILLKVSFDRKQFNSELCKCRRWLTAEEYGLLLDWARSNIAVFSNEEAGKPATEVLEKQTGSTP